MVAISLLKLFTNCLRIAETWLKHKKHEMGRCSMNAYGVADRVAKREGVKTVILIQMQW